MKRAYHGDWMDTLPSVINEIPDENIEKNEVGIEQTTEELDFNQDSPIEFEGEYRSQMG